MARKKKISSWKKKRPFEVFAPESFNNKSLGQSVAAEAKILIGRTLTISAKDLTEDRTKQHFDLTFIITDVEGDNAKTKLKKFAVSPSFLKSKIRKRMTKIDYVSDATFKGERSRVKILIAAGKKVSRGQKKNINDRITEILGGHSENRADEIIQMAVYGKLGTEIFHGIKNIGQVHRVEVHEIKIL